MCACTLHFASVPMNAVCTCVCSDHEPFRRTMLYGTTTTTDSANINTNAPSVTRTVLFGDNAMRVYEGGNSHQILIGSSPRFTAPNDPGPTEAEVAEAIESIKKAMPDGD
jgi:hypothetical protein